MEVHALYVFARRFQQNLLLVRFWMAIPAKLTTGVHNAKRCYIQGVAMHSSHPDFQMCHKTAGLGNVAADALSRYPCHNPDP